MFYDNSEDSEHVSSKENQELFVRNVTYICVSI